MLLELRAESFVRTRILLPEIIVYERRITLPGKLSNYTFDTSSTVGSSLDIAGLAQTNSCGNLFAVIYVTRMATLERQALLGAAA